jgi:hypothetical protein
VCLTDGLHFAHRRLILLANRLCQRPPTIRGKTGDGAARCRFEERAFDTDCANCFAGIVRTHGSPTALTGLSRAFLEPPWKGFFAIAAGWERADVSLRVRPSEIGPHETSGNVRFRAAAVVQADIGFPSRSNSRPPFAGPFS